MAKIGIDIQAVMTPRKSGLGVYTENIFKALLGQNPAPGHIPARGHDFFLYGMEKPVENTVERLVWENFRLPAHARRDGIDLLHVPAFAPPVCRPAKLVVTVHDLIGMLFPNQRGTASAFYWGKWLPWTTSRADHIIADSESTRKDLITHLAIAEKRISVVYCSGHEGFVSDIEGDRRREVLEKFGIVRPYFLFVGTVEPRKNLRRVMKAFAALRSQASENLQLVIVGARDFAHGSFVKELLAGSSLRNDELVFTGYVSHEELNALYCASLAFLFPSLYEGFGIPVLEAMASGAPVIASSTSSVPEVAGEATLLVNPESEEGLCDAMLRLVEDIPLRERLRRAGFDQVTRFSWKKSAQQILEIYRKLLGE